MSADSSPTAVPAVEQEPPSGTIRWCCVKCGESNQQTPAMPFLPCVRCGCTIPLCVAMEPSVQPPTEAGMPASEAVAWAQGMIAWHRAEAERLEADAYPSIRRRAAEHREAIDALTALAQLTAAHETAVRENEEAINNARLSGAVAAIKAAQSICESRASSLMQQTPVRRISESNEATKCAIAIGSMWRDALPPDDPLYVKWTLLDSRSTPTSRHDERIDD